MNLEDLPPAKSNNRWYCHHQSDEVLVFIHGVLSDSRDCWLADGKGEKQAAYWPNLIFSDSRFKNIGVYLAGYHTGVDSGDFPIQQCAAEVFSYLKTEDSNGRPAVLSKNKITFIGHSMGGIVARYLLCEYRDEFKEKDVGLVLVASPSFGSKLQHSLDHIIYLYNHEQGKQLRWASDILKELDTRFKNLKDGNKIKSLHGIEFFENRFIFRSKWLPWFSRTKVVSNESAARYFGDAKMVGGSDHMSICKPMTIQDAVHQYLLEFLKDKKLLPHVRRDVSQTEVVSHLNESVDNSFTYMSSSVSASKEDPSAIGLMELQPSRSSLPISRRDIKSVLTDFQSFDPIKGHAALDELFDLNSVGEDALFAQPLSIRSMVVRRRMLDYVRTRAATVTPRLLEHLQNSPESADAHVAAELLSGVPFSRTIISNISEQLLGNFTPDCTLFERRGAADRLLALGNAGAYAGDLREYVDHDTYAWEKFSAFAFRGACMAFVRTGEDAGDAVARLLVQTGPSRICYPSPDLESKTIPREAIADFEIQRVIYGGAFTMWRSGAAVDNVLSNWSSGTTHWRLRYLAAEIVASAGFTRTVDPVDKWLLCEPDQDVRTGLFSALGAARTVAGADALLARYLQYERIEGQHSFARSAWRCSDSDMAIQELERLVKISVEKFPASIVSLARLKRRPSDLKLYLSSQHSFVRANAALAMGYLQDQNDLASLNSQLREAAAPLERICIAVALLMIKGSPTKLLHDELVAAGENDDFRLKIDPFFLFDYIKEAIGDAFNAAHGKESLAMGLWCRELQPLT